MSKFIKAVNSILERKDLSDSTKKIYKTNLMKLYDVLKSNKQSTMIFIETGLVEEAIDKLYESNSSRLIIYKAVIKIIESNNKINSSVKEFYKNKSIELKRIIQEEKSDNVVIDESSWMTLNELKDVPNKVKSLLPTENLFISNTVFNLNLNKTQKQLYLKLLSEYVFLYIHSNRIPIRLDFCNLLINYNEDIILPNNYLTYDKNKMTLYLNDFKNVRSLGPQKQLIEKDIYDVLKNWFTVFEYVMGHKPKYVLYQYRKNDIFIPFASKENFGQYLTRLFYKYSSKKITINTIRKIYESDFIQSDRYKLLSNKEKDNFHKRLLHSAVTANASYNKIVK